MLSIETCGSFEPVIFTIGSGSDDEDTGDHHSEVCTKSAEEFCVSVVNSGKTLEDTTDIMQCYYKKLLSDKERLLSGLAEKQQKLKELQLRRRKLEQMRDQIESTVRLSERRVVLLSEENFRRRQTVNKCQKYKEILQNLIKEVTLQSQSMQTRACSRLRLCYQKLKKHLI